MKPVNLLPQKHRPAAPTGERSGSAYVVLGVLGVVLAAVVLYVLTANSINSQREQVTKAQEETAEAEAKTRHLQPYGDFSTVAQTRVSSVRQQAQGRIDWERLVRELAHVLPAGSWLTSADAAATPELRDNGGEDVDGPSIQLTGCAHSQRDVATLLVRLRRISGATDVQLAESTQGEDQATTAGAVGSASPEDCGQSGGQPNYTWDATVIFEPSASGEDAEGGKVPARLGGGS
jgi:Tfp pilus assembly protein PilN